MIDAEMYGMMLSAKMVMRLSAPPENTSTIPRMPPAVDWKTWASATGSMPGTGM